jgi:hypothetical protein
MKKSFLGILASLVCVSAWATPTFDPANGHYYDVIATNGITWNDAHADALAASYNSLEGHLVTITSAAEDAFVGALIAQYASGEVWAGGFQNPITETIPTAGWTWVNGEGTFPGVSSTTPFANWNSGEPNDYYGTASEQYLGLDLGNSSGGFNDEGNLSLITGYVIEYDPNTINDLPDAASTAALLSGTLVVLGTVRRRFSK